MRLWSLHPRYLDPQGLVALWREGLLCQAVLFGETRGYRHHPQLERFRAASRPEVAIGTYLSYVLREAQARGYAFDGQKIRTLDHRSRLLVTSGQLELEATHLESKLRLRSPSWLEELDKPPAAHPMFRVRKGGIASWERG